MKIVKFIKNILLMVLSLNVFGQSNASGKPMDLYLLIGQSNMAGRGPMDNVSEMTSEGIWMLDKDNNWVLAKDPLHFDKSYAAVGPGLSFAQAMLEGQKNKPIGLIPCAWGGSPIKVWTSGQKYFDNYPYDFAIERAKIAMRHGELKGILWHQGESDNTPEKAAVYLEKLKALVTNLRRDLNAPNLPFVAGEIGYFNKENNINAIINQLPAEEENTAVVSAADLSDKGDQLHFNTASARELGKRYALAMKKLLDVAVNKKKEKTLNATQSNNKKLKKTVVLTFDDAEISHFVNVAPVLKEFKYKASFFVTEFPRKEQDEEKEFMNWTQIKKLHKIGFEIGNHSGHHKNLTKLSPEKIVNEVSYIEDKCKEYGIPKPVSFAYPGNRNDSISEKILKDMGYRYARTGGAKYYNKDTDSPMAVPSFTVISSDKYEKRTMEAIENLNEGETLVLTIHGVPDVLHPDYSTSVEFLRELLNLLKKKKFRVIPMKEL